MATSPIQKPAGTTIQSPKAPGTTAAKPAANAAAAPASKAWTPAGGAARPTGDAFAAKTNTRWDYPKGLSSGVFLSPGENPHPMELLAQAPKDFPGSKTFLYYKSIAANPNDLPDSYFAQARAEGIVPQIGFESGNLNLKDMRAALEGKGKLPEKTASGADIPRNQQLNQTYQSLAGWADHLKGQGPVIFRPLSEMNDASGAWEMGKPGNSPQDFSAVWNEMHSLFDAHGATNLRWTFDVLAVQGQPASGKVRQVLQDIPAKNIDNMGMNPYSMPVGGQFESPKALMGPWLQLFKETGHGNTRPVISEMGVTNNPKGHNVAGNNDPNALKPGTAAYKKLDAQRAQWIHDAFAYARANNFASVTYFTQMNTHWRVDPGSMAYSALQKEIAKG